MSSIALPVAGRVRERLVEPGRFWIRHVPQAWPG
jgi:hypothetical protein